MGSKGKKHTVDPEIDLHEIGFGRGDHFLDYLGILESGFGQQLWIQIVPFPFLSTLCLLAEPSF